jgi:hypothetical protein
MPCPGPGDAARVRALLEQDDAQAMPLCNAAPAYAFSSEFVMPLRNAFSSECVTSKPTNPALVFLFLRVAHLRVCFRECSGSVGGALSSTAG